MFGLNRTGILLTGQTLCLGKLCFNFPSEIRLRLFQFNQTGDRVLYPDCRGDQPVPETDLQDDSRQQGEEPDFLPGHRGWEVERLDRLGEM